VDDGVKESGGVGGEDDVIKYNNKYATEEPCQSTKREESLLEAEKPREESLRP
jgi:hypothetical protein